MVLRESRGRGLLALGAVLARRGAMATASFGIAAISVLGFSLFAILAARRGHADVLRDVPLLASTALAYGAGVLLAFAVSSRAFQRDAHDGVGALLRMRGLGVGEYLSLRVVGLAAVLAVVVAGGSAVVAIVATLAARGRVAAFDAAGAGLAAVVFGLAFAVTFAPVAMAALGNRTRAGGYLALVLVLVVPELAGPTLARMIDPRWAAVSSIPGALFALREALSPGSFDLGGVARAALVLAVFILLSLVVVRAEVRRSERADAP